MQKKTAVKQYYNALFFRFFCFKNFSSMVFVQYPCRYCVINYLLLILIITINDILLKLYFLTIVVFIQKAAINLRMLKKVLTN